MWKGNLDPLEIELCLKVEYIAVAASAKYKISNAIVFLGRSNPANSNPICQFVGVVWPGSKKGFQDQNGAQNQSDEQSQRTKPSRSVSQLAVQNHLPNGETVRQRDGLHFLNDGGATKHITDFNF
jgi:hypothetical protein